MSPADQQARVALAQEGRGAADAAARVEQLALVGEAQREARRRASLGGGRESASGRWWTLTTTSRTPWRASSASG